MKGKLSKFQDKWGVIYDIPNPPIATATVEWLPLDPSYVKYYFLDEDAEGGDVEFTFSEKWYELEGKTVVDKYARLKRPEEQTNGERFEEFMKIVEGYPELEGTNALCEDIIEKRTGKMTEEEWLAAERAQAKEEQKGILVELMELDSKDGLYHPSSQTEIEKLASKHYPEYYSIGLGNDRIGFERGYNLGKSSQTEISDKPHSTITDQIDGIIFELPFDDKMKLWELIDELVSESQTEISDEEIDNYIDKNFIFNDEGNWQKKYFKAGAVWYREQLKKKQ